MQTATVTTSQTPPPSLAPVRLALHAGQAAVYRAKRKVRFRVVVAGRRWGKTHLARTELIAAALEGGPGHYWYVAPDRQMAKDIMWRALKQAIDPSWMAGTPSETELSITLVNGAVISLKGAEDPDRLRGRALRFVVLDEFADMRPETWEEVLRPALADFQAPALFIGTPKAYNALYSLFLRGQTGGDPDWQSWQFRTVDNPTMSKAEIESARLSMDARTYRQEYEASFEAVGGRAYVAFSRVRHVAPVTLDTAFPVAVSFDFNINPAVAIIGQRQGDRAVIWREVFLKGLGGDATREAAQAAAAHLARAGWRGRVRVYGDPAGKAGKTTGPSDHQVVRQVFPGCEWAVAHAQPHPRDRVASVNWRCEQDALTVDPSCIHLVADFEQVTLKDNGDLNKEPGALLTHISDAAAYFIIREWPVVRRQPLAVLQVPAPDHGSTALARIRQQKTDALRRELAAMGLTH